jgi:predicted RNA-binding Zn ribbon-like protein
MVATPIARADLDLVIDFVNTLDLEKGEDALATPKSLATWLVENGLVRRAAATPSEAEHAEAIELREALRALMLANNGVAADAHATEVLERAACRGQLGVHFRAGDSVELAPAQESFAGALAWLLVPVARGIEDGSWARAKACRSDDCAWAFYDRSRNRSGVWCEMAVCGNRTKVRAYRHRSRGRDAHR